MREIGKIGPASSHRLAGNIHPLETRSWSMRRLAGQTWSPGSFWKIPETRIVYYILVESRVHMHSIQSKNKTIKMKHVL